VSDTAELAASPRLPASSGDEPRIDAAGAMTGFAASAASVANAASVGEVIAGSEPASSLSASGLAGDATAGASMIAVSLVPRVARATRKTATAERSPTEMPTKT
jgi:hypothetical protein